MRPSAMERIAEQHQTRIFFFTEIQDTEIAERLAELPYQQMMIVYMRIWKQMTWTQIGSYLELTKKEVIERWDEVLDTLGGSLRAFLAVEVRCESRTPKDSSPSSG